MSGPLSSLKLLDFTTLLPGPYASMMMADLGAEVVHVEAPHRPDMVRFMPPYDGDTSAWHALLNRSKRSLSLDLKKPGAVEVIKRLVSAAGGAYDIVLEQFRPGVMDRLGIGYEALRAVNPCLIYCAITGYGQTGPYRDRAGHDNNYLSLAGVMSHTGRRDSGPPPLGVQVADIGGGSFGAVTGTLAAVIHRQQTGEGQLVDISMFDMSVAWHAHPISAYLVGGEEPGRETWRLNGGSFYDYYETQDGRFLSVGSLEPKFWQGFCDAIERPDLTEQGYSLDPAVQHSLKVELRAVIAARPLAEWITVFQDEDVCVEPVLTISEMLDHPQTKAREMVVEVPRADGKGQRQIGTPYKFSRSRPEYRHIGAPLGAHTGEVLAEAGYSDGEIQSLGDAGAFGEGPLVETGDEDIASERGSKRGTGET
jgi:crotonobetainyl-CoA:carnitine CoA-transferase CaiB-like acyl-CoA transferase